MAITVQDIEDLIRASFPEAQITVEGDDGQHFTAQVIDASFKGMNRVAQQRAVYAALKGKMDGSAGE
ncbi:MAG: BolA/IbaG family iron-sulfur metabolism protein, partial [Rhodobacteraceae bacterium]|nr:BolA/IbaG family iron-sulfur metabolism protein [Paracoccaceae bacterium]